MKPLATGGRLPPSAPFIYQHSNSEHRSTAVRLYHRSWKAFLVIWLLVELLYLGVMFWYGGESGIVIVGATIGSLILAAILYGIWVLDRHMHSDAPAFWRDNLSRNAV